jgi:hypothetical protein
MEEKDIKSRGRHIMKRCNFMISDYQLETLRSISKNTGLSMSDLVRQGLQVTIKEYSNVIRKKD